MHAPPFRYVSRLGLTKGREDKLATLFRLQRSGSGRFGEIGTQRLCLLVTHRGKRTRGWMLGESAQPTENLCRRDLKFLGQFRVWHYFPVPPATYNRASWLEWVRDRLIEVETHEVCEFMRLEVDRGIIGPDGERDLHVERPFAPNHGPGWNPYVVRTLNREEDAETTFRGKRREGSQA